ncbi:MAG: extracellular solute-binding protein [Acidobacteria bacterium]|nr:extracellular solute-binding protein [Acidobacteriota bacterium]
MRKILYICLMSGWLAALGCGYLSEIGGGDTATSLEPRGPVSMDKNDYPVFPDADAGADPAVSAEQGGRGFTGEGWETNTEFDFIGDPRAVKGGLLREAILDFPGTLRIIGPESNTQLNYMVGPMVYESLLTLHPTTLEYIPVLATHWQISPDKMTYRFRINPNARWADGQPVTAEDVVASWTFRMDEGLQAPSSRMTYGKFEKPVAESKYIVRVKSIKVNWRNFYYFSGLTITPAHILKDVDGAAYLRDYNFKMLPGTGPYVVREEDIDKGNSLTIRKRTDYWAEKHRLNVGLNNFEQIKEIVVRDPNLQFEMLKKGDLDYYFVNTAQKWVEELDFDRIQRGLIQKRKVFNHAPQGVQGLAFNMRRVPFDDIRVRKALFHLFNRAQLVEKLMFNEYLLQHSYYTGGVYENPDNPKILYDPELALNLLAEAGWRNRDERGRLLKNGQPLEIEILYSSQPFERYFTVYQEDLRKVGITLNLRLVTPETRFKLMMERQFDTVAAGWGALLFPNPETSYHSSLADVNNTNNITGIKSSRIDELTEAYDGMFEVDERIAAIQEIDGILANLYPYILEWTAPFGRVAYWNKFGHPAGYFSRIGDYTDMPSLWWIDPEKLEQLNQAQRDPSIQLEVGQTEDRYWLDFAQVEQQANPTETP